MVIRVISQKQYAMPGRAAMFAWKPLYTAFLPIPRTDGRYRQQAHSKAELKAQVAQHLRAFGMLGKFTLTFEGDLNGN